MFISIPLAEALTLTLALARLPPSTDAFDQLADLLSAFPSVLRNSHFIFVPGPSDPFASPLLPRPALPEILIAKLRVRLGPRAHFASNPARIQYFGQEIVVYRDDVMGRMLRNSVRLKDEPNEAELKKYVSSKAFEASTRRDVCSRVLSLHFRAVRPNAPLSSFRRC